MVVGAGFWGTAISLALREAGREVLCLDCDQPGAASPAAAGLVRQSTLDRLAVSGPRWWTEQHSQACQDFLQWGMAEGWARLGQERIVSDYQPRLRPGLWCVECAQLLSLAGAESGRVVRLEPRSGHWWVETEEGPVQARQVVVAAGFFSDALLAASHLPTLGIQPLPGSGLLAQASRPLLEPLTLAYRLTGDTRTRTATARNWVGNRVRVGDTLEPGEHEQMEVLRQLLEQAGGQGPIVKRWGIRPALVQLCVEKVAENLVVASGGKRTGLATAAGAARRVVDLLSQ